VVEEEQVEEEQEPYHVIMYVTIVVVRAILVSAKFIIGSATGFQICLEVVRMGHQKLGKVLALVLAVEQNR